MCSRGAVHFSFQFLTNTNAHHFFFQFIISANASIIDPGHLSISYSYKHYDRNLGCFFENVHLSVEFTRE